MVSQFEDARREIAGQYRKPDLSLERRRRSLDHHSVAQPGDGRGAYSRNPRELLHRSERPAGLALLQDRRRASRADARQIVEIGKRGGIEVYGRGPPAFGGLG
jgi:hypothetical protein